MGVVAAAVVGAEKLREPVARAFKEKFGNLQADGLTDLVMSLALEFLHEHQPADKKLVKA